jgi:hypothetical protein
MCNSFSSPQRKTSLSSSPKRLELSSLFAVCCVMLVLFASPSSSRAAELVMFEQAGCEWCAAFDREIAPIYPKTDEGRRAPLRRIDITRPLPQDLAFIAVERVTPLFVLVDNGREIGRIRGYPGEDNFWGLLDAMMKTVNGPGPAQAPE